ncbi:YcbK family protein [Azospirillum sp. ST 5-10]|uniref:YcbK family protein n=1 Tax=unclassified Azospirillum TaxID=2630922 RepID=UPI003F4A2550
MRLSRRALMCGVLATGTLAGCATGPNPDAGPDTPRSIVLVHPESGESVAVTYWRPGGYESKALFEIGLLFRDRRAGDFLPVDPALIETIVAVRDRLGLPPDTPIHLTSGYRSPITNASLARANGHVAENSYHVTARAADIRIPGVPGRRVAAAAAELRRGGYAYYPGSDHVHIDTGPPRTWTVR